MSAPAQAIEAFVDAICQLAKANRLTGIWDNRRFQECRKEFSAVDCAYLYKTEKLSRANVELRAVYRTQIDAAFSELMSAVAERRQRHGPPADPASLEGRALPAAGPRRGAP